jgi:type 2 lantibiotic biosynthesis protein LanM
LNSAFNIKGYPISIEWPLSDFHNNGKSHIFLIFSCSTKIIFKYKDDKCKSIIDDVILRLSTLKYNIDYRTTKRLSFDDFYWEEFVQYKPLKTESDLPKYYYNIGKYLGLFHLMGVSDIINDNIICHETTPVFIDIEFLLRPNIIFSGKEIFPKGFSFFSNSCLSVGILPFLTTNVADEHGFDSGGISNIPKKKAHTRIFYSSSNRLEYKQEYIDLENKHFPHCNVDKVLPNLYIKEIISGFKYTLSFIESKKNIFISIVEKAIEKYNPSCRFLFRHTSSYELVLKESLHPDYLTKIKNERINFLNCLTELSDVEPLNIELIRKEQHDLLNLDIPIFYYNPTEKCIQLNDTKVEVFEKTGIEIIKEKIKGLNVDYTSTQINLLVKALACFYKIDEYQVNTINKNTINLSEPINTENILEIVIKFADTLLENSLQLDKNITWLDISSNRTSNWELNLKKSGLYDGIDGIGLFFIYLFKLTGIKRYNEVSLNLLESSLHIFQNVFNHERNYYLFSPFNFPFSTLYFLHHYNKVTNEIYYDIDTLINNKVKPYIVNNAANDKHIDFINGVSGLLSFLCDYLAYSKQKKVIFECIYILKDIITKYAVNTQYGIAWNIFKFDKLIGFAHGSSGIIYALSKYVNVTNDENVKKIIFDAIKFNQKYFDTNFQNWIDLRYNDHRLSNASWCHGLCGITIPYLHIIQNLKLDIPSVSWNKIAQNIINTGLRNNHCLCHGLFGNIEALFAIGNYLHKPDLIDVTL